MWPSNWSFGFFTDKGSFQKRIIKYLLQRTIGRFIKDELDWDKDLDVQISNGVFQLRHLKLNEEALSEVLGSLPVVVKSGTIGLIKAEITWSNLLSGGCKIELQNLSIEVELLEARSSYKFDDIPETLFTDGGQSILTSSVYIADDFIKQEETRNFKFPTNFNFSPNLENPTTQNSLDSNDKLNLISGIVDKIIFGTDVFINDVSLNISCSNCNPQGDSSTLPGSAIIVKLAELSLQDYHKSKINQPNIKERKDFSSSSSSEKIQFDVPELKYQYIHIGKTEKRISLSGLKILLKKDSRTNTIAALLDTPLDLKFTLLRKLPFAYLEPVYNEFVYNNPLNPNMGIDHDSDIGFVSPMPGEFRNILPSLEATEPSTSKNNFSVNQNQSQNQNMNENPNPNPDPNPNFHATSFGNLSKEGWQLDMQIGTLALVLRPDNFSDFLNVYQSVNEWVARSYKTQNIISDYYNSHPQAFTNINYPTDISDVSANNFKNTMASVLLEKLVLVLLSPLDPKEPYPHDLDNWDGHLSLVGLEQTVSSFKHVKLTFDQMKLSTISQISGSSREVSAEYPRTDTLKNDYYAQNSQFNCKSLDTAEKVETIEFSIKKISVIEHDPLMSPTDYDIIKFDWNLLLDNRYTNKSQHDFWGLFDNIKNSNSVFIAPFDIELGLALADRLAPYAKIGDYLDSQQSHKSVKACQTSANPSHANRSIVTNRNTANVRSGLGRNETMADDDDNDSGDDNDDFVVRSKVGTFLDVKNYMNTVEDDFERQNSPDGEPRGPSNESGSSISIIALMIRLRLVLPSLNDLAAFDNPSTPGLTLGISELIEGIANLQKTTTPSLQNKQVVLDWFDVSLFKSKRTEVRNQQPVKTPGGSSDINDNFGLRLEGGNIKVYIDSGNSLRLQSNSEDFNYNTSNDTPGSYNMIHFASIGPLGSSDGSTGESTPMPCLEITLQPQNSMQQAKSNWANKVIPRPPMLVGLEGKFEHDTKSRRSLDSERKVTLQYQQRCLDRAEITVDLLIPFTEVFLDEKKLFVISKFMEVLSLYMAKQQQNAEVQSKSNNKKLLVVLSNFKKISISVENKFRHSLELQDTQAFIVVGLVEEDKTYCHIHSHSLNYDYTDTNNIVTSVLNNTMFQKNMLRTNLPQFSIDYLSTPLLPDLNELVVRVDWSTFEIDNFLACHEDIINFFDKTNTTGVAGNENMGKNNDIAQNESNSHSVLCSNQPEEKNIESVAYKKQTIETSPLQLYVFIRNLSLRYGINTGSKKIAPSQYLPKSIVLGIETISLLNLFNSPEQGKDLEPKSKPKLEHQDNSKLQLRKINIGGISFMGLPNKDASTTSTSEQLNITSEISLALNPEKHWISLGHAVLFHVAVIDLGLVGNCSAAECELVRVELHSDTLPVIQQLAEYFAEVFVEKKMSYTEFFSSFENGLNVLDDIDQFIFHPTNENINKYELETNPKSSNTLKMVQIEDNKHSENVTKADIRTHRGNRDQELAQGDSLNTSKGRSYLNIEKNENYFDSGFDAIQAEEAQGSMEDYRSAALRYRHNVSDLSTHNSRGVYKPHGFSRSARSSGKVNRTTISFSDEETEKIESDIDDFHARFITNSTNNSQEMNNTINDHLFKDHKTENASCEPKLAWIDDYFDSSNDSSFSDLKSESNSSKSENGGRPMKKMFSHRLVVGKIQALVYSSPVWPSKNSFSKHTSANKPQIEIEALNLRIHFNKYVPSAHFDWNLILNLGQLNIYDMLESSQWNKFLTRMHVSEYKHYDIHPMLYHKIFKRVTKLSSPKWISGNKYSDPHLPDILRLSFEAVKHGTQSDTKNTQKILVDGNELVEFRIDVEMAPIRCYIDQDALTFLIYHFSGKFNRDPQQNLSQNESTKKPHSSMEMQHYFQAVSISPILIKFDYKPKQAPLSSRNTASAQSKPNEELPVLVELLNIIALEEASLTLQPVQLYGITGATKLVSNAASIWLPHITQKQIPGVVGSLIPLKPFAEVGTAAIDMILLPISEYKKNGKWYKGLQSGVKAFAQTSALEAMNLGAKVAVNTQSLLEQAGDILNVPSSSDKAGNGERSPTPKARGSSKYAEQPTSAADGVRQAYKSLSKNFSQVARTILAIPVQYGDNYDFDLEFEYVENRGDQYSGGEELGDDNEDEVFVTLDTFGDGRRTKKSSKVNNSMKRMVRAVPIAVLNPIIGASEAVSKTLLGLRNTLEANRNSVLQDKYKSRSKR